MRNTVTAIILNNEGKFLIEDHVKCNAYTFPGGKVDDTDVTLTDAIRRELREELGITVQANEVMHLFSKYIEGSEYPAGSGNYTKYLANVYLIINYKGEIKNAEPNKHRSIQFSSLEELKELKHTDVAESVLEYLDDDIRKELIINKNSYTLY